MVLERVENCLCLCFPQLFLALIFDETVYYDYVDRKHFCGIMDYNFFLLVCFPFKDCCFSLSISFQEEENLLLYWDSFEKI